MAYNESRSPVPLQVVVVGGGTGNSTVLSGMKPWVGEGLTAIVNTFDDGGGTGKLRDEYEGLLAVGDLRQCLEALSHAPEEERALFNHRFQKGKGAGEIGLHGQTLGNLIIAAAGQQNGGNFSEALSLVGRMYDITGQVLPASHDNRRLEITTPNGLVIKGEHAAEMTEVPSLRGSKVSFDKEPTNISPEAEAAIKDADMVVLAPGDLYTSLAPALVVRGMKEALKSSTAVIQVSNLMNRSRHTVGFTALDYAQEYERLIGDRVIDRVIYNTHSPNQIALEAQAQAGSYPVEAAQKSLEKAGFTAIGKDLLSNGEVQLDPNDAIAETRTTIRHDPTKVAHALMAVYFGNGFATH